MDKMNWFRRLNLLASVKEFHMWYCIVQTLKTCKLRDMENYISANTCPFLPPKKYQRVYYESGLAVGNGIDFVTIAMVDWGSQGDLSAALLCTSSAVSEQPQRLSSTAKSVWDGLTGYRHRCTWLNVKVSIGAVPKYLQPSPFLLICHRGRTLLPCLLRCAC